MYRVIALSCRTIDHHVFRSWSCLPAMGSYANLHLRRRGLYKRKTKQYFHMFKGLRPVLEGFVVTMHDLTYCSHKPECIVTTNPDRSVLITIITWHFQFRPMNVSILHLKYDYPARSESRFACYSHCYVTWYPLTTGTVASQCPSARDAVLVTRYLPFISACLNSFSRFLPQ